MHCALLTAAREMEINSGRNQLIDVAQEEFKTRKKAVVNFGFGTIIRKISLKEIIVIAICVNILT